MGESLLQEGMSLMLYGMGTVFVFLTVLVYVTTAMSFITNRFFSAPEVDVEPSPAMEYQNNIATDDVTLSMIAVAIKKFRERRDQSD